MKKYLNSLVVFVKKYYILIIIFLMYIIITYSFNMPNCIIKLICGYPCPGCGLTRAGFSLLRLDFYQAFNFNPLIYVVPLVILVIIYKDCLFFNKIYLSKLFWFGLLLLVLGLYIYRMIVVYPDVPMNYESDNLIKSIIKVFS